MTDVNRYTVEDCAGFAAGAAMSELESESAFESGAAGYEEEPVMRRALHVLRALVEKRLEEL